ncbi:uncharacterized protein [Amphiura filiformis]|uniref:uncharacterized protein n=1 Tax=Amphiura filiformis TaxID=82378 RepID=UPI003B211307
MAFRVNLDFSAMKSRTVWFCALANLCNVFAVTFIVLYLTFGQYLTAELCIYITSTFLVGAVFVVLMLRKSQLSKNRLETFLGPVREGLIAHRGAALESPENTLLALREAKKNGASSVEFDLEMTSDGVAVLLHDDTVDRTTDGMGEIKNMTFEEVRKLNAAANFGPKSNNNFEQIPTVEEAVLLCKDLDLNIFFDVKNYSKEMLNFLEGLFQKYPHLYNSGIVCSFYPQVIYQLRRCDDQILTGLTTEPNFIQSKCKGSSVFGSLLITVLDYCLAWSFYSWLWFLVGNSAVLLKHTTVSRDVVQFWRERDVAVVTWTVNTQEGKDHFTELQVPVITDAIKRSKYQNICYVADVFAICSSMLPQLVLFRQTWLKCLIDLSLFHAAIFCGLILLFSHWITFAACFHIAICFEAVTLIVLVLFKTAAPTKVCVKAFCEGELPITELGSESNDVEPSDVEPSDVEPSDGGSVKWEFVRKAGGGHDAPENTLAAILQSKQYNVSGIVADLRVTLDGVIVLCHDECVVRTTDGTGQVAEMSYEEIKTLNAAAKFKSANGVSFGHESVPSLEDAIQLCDTLNLNILMDLKDTSIKMMHALLVLFKKYPWLYDKAVVCSFMPFVLYRIRKHDRNIMTGLRTRKNYLEWNYIDPLDPSWWQWAMVVGDMALTWSVYAWLWYFCGISFVLLYKDTISRQVLDLWKQQNVCVIAWTLNDVKEKYHMTNVFGIPVITDLMGSDDEPDRKRKGKASKKTSKLETIRKCMTR